MLLSDLLHQFPELSLLRGDPAQLAVRRIDALHSTSTPVDGTLYLHADATEATRIVSGWQGQFRLTSLAVLTAQSGEAVLDAEPAEVAWVEHAVSGPLPIDLSARLLRVLFESQPRSVGEDEQLQDELVEELLTRREDYALETLRRAHQAALDLSRFDVVVLVGGRSYDQGTMPGSLPTRQALVRETRRAAAERGAGTGVFRLGTHVVALLDSRRQPPEEFAARLAASLHTAFPTSYVLAAVGRAVGRANELGASYRDARAALEVTLDTVRLERWVRYDEVRHLLFYREIQRSPELTALVEGSLRPLLDLPGEYRKVLLETLVAYLEHNRSPHRAAVALGVHPNTLKYRMKRIAEFIDLNTLSGGTYVLYFLAAKLNT